ncbi:MAG: hypothetical protein IAE99_07965 [Rhodothermales bacterium]|nr:hypothetical protein [Rhodothermales bacterium]
MPQPSVFRGPSRKDRDRLAARLDDAAALASATDAEATFIVRVIPTRTGGVDVHVTPPLLPLAPPPAAS